MLLSTAKTSDAAVVSMAISLNPPLVSDYKKLKSLSPSGRQCWIQRENDHMIIIFTLFTIFWMFFWWEESSCCWPFPVDFSSSDGSTTNATMLISLLLEYSAFLLCVLPHCRSCILLRFEYSSPQQNSCVPVHSRVEMSAFP